MSILLIAGSPTLPSRSAALLDYVDAQLAKTAGPTEKLTVRDLPAEALLHADFNHPQIVAAIERIAQADALVIGTPVYKAAYSGILKAFLDLLPQTGLAGKSVLPIATGGSPAHTLALDYALRPVLTSLHAQVLPGIYALDSQAVLLPESGLHLSADIEERVHDGVRRLAEVVNALREEARARERAAAPSVPFSQVRCST
jgi:FMN reductase